MVFFGSCCCKPSEDDNNADKLVQHFDSSDAPLVEIKDDVLFKPAPREDVKETPASPDEPTPSPKEEPVKDEPAPAPEEAPEELVPVEIEPAPAEDEVAANPGFIEFEACFQKTKATPTVGLRLDAFNSAFLTVKGLNDGKTLVNEWNANNTTAAVLPGDAIVEVNGITGSTATLSAIKDSKEVKMRLRRVPEFTASVDKTKGPLGLTLYGKDVCFVRAVLDNHELAKWNASCEPGQFVVPGDQVVEVNGIPGGYKEIVAAASEATGMTEIRIRH